MTLRVSHWQLNKPLKRTSEYKKSAEFEIRFRLLELQLGSRNTIKLPNWENGKATEARKQRKRSDSSTEIRLPQFNLFPVPLTDTADSALTDLQIQMADRCVAR
jgi:hypothetical protein